MSTTLREVENLLRSLGERPSAQRLADLVAGRDRPELHVVIFGEFNRGKSTLINALLGRLVLPARLVPTTGHVTRVVFGNDEQVRVRHVDGRLASCPLSQLASFTALDKEGRAREDVAEIEVAVACPLLRGGLVLVDTPGVGDQEAQTRRARKAIAQADLVLLVLDARQLLGHSESELASDWMRRELGKPVALVVNFVNLVEESGMPELRARLDRWCGGHLGRELGRPWFAINALAALKAGLGSGPLPADDFAGLREALLGCRGPRGQQLQQQSRRGQLLGEVRALRTHNGRILHNLQTDATRVKCERDRRRGCLQDLRRRFTAMSAGCHERLASLAQQELDKSLESLVHHRFRDESKTQLRENATRWYREHLSGAVRAIEMEADGHLAELVDDNLRRPQPLTLHERLELDVRIEVDDGDSWWLVDVVSEWVHSLFGWPTPNHAAAYSAQVRPRWADHSRGVLAALRGQFDDRLEEVQQQFDEGLHELEAPAAQERVMEVGQRERLEVALAYCERELQGA